MSIDPQTHARMPQVRFPVSVVLYFALGIAGVLAPLILALDVTPPWLVWILSGSGGGGESWQLLGGVAIFIALTLFFHWAGDRYQWPLLTKIGTGVQWTVCAAAAVVVVIFVPLVSGMVLSFIVDWLADVLPNRSGDPLQWFSSEPGIFVLAGVFVVIVAFAIWRSIRRVRREHPDADRIDHVVSGGMPVLEAAFLLGLTSFTALATWGMALVFAEGLAPWLNAYSRSLLVSAVILTTLFPFLLHHWRRYRHTGGDSPQFADACFTTLLIIGISGAILIGFMIAASSLGS